jgi:hypothetical protein
MNLPVYIFQKGIHHLILKTVYYISIVRIAISYYASFHYAHLFLIQGATAHVSPILPATSPYFNASGHFGEMKFLF